MFATLIAAVMAFVVLFIASLCGPVRRRVLPALGLLKSEPGEHRCCFCDLYDDDRSACLVMIYLPAGVKNLKTKRFSKCAWRGKAGEYVSAFEIDNEAQRLKMEFERAEKDDKARNTVDSSKVLAEEAQSTTDTSKAATETDHANTPT